MLANCAPRVADWRLPLLLLKQANDACLVAAEVSGKVKLKKQRKIKKKRRRLAQEQQQQQQQQQQLTTPLSTTRTSLLPQFSATAKLPLNNAQHLKPETKTKTKTKFKTKSSKKIKIIKTTLNDITITETESVINGALFASAARNNEAKILCCRRQTSETTCTRRLQLSAAAAPTQVPPQLQPPPPPPPHVLLRARRAQSLACDQSSSRAFICKRLSTSSSFRRSSSPPLMSTGACMQRAFALLCCVALRATCSFQVNASLQNFALNADNNGNVAVSETGDQLNMNDVGVAQNLNLKYNLTTITPLTTTTILDSNLNSNNNQELATTNAQTVDDLIEQILYIAKTALMVSIIICDICGNSLVILSVCKHKKLRVTTNWFVVSLACADILVALFAMTFNASVQVSNGRWLFATWVCDFWTSADMLFSTASILHLCCISIDRYVAIIRPLDYRMKITTRRVMYALAAVWVTSALMSYIPIFTGIYTTAEHIEWWRAHPDKCELVVNRPFAIISSSVSFWIPCCIMLFTYHRIYMEATRQEKFIHTQAMLQPKVHHHHHQQHNQTKQQSNNNNNSNNSNNTTTSSSRSRRSKSIACGANNAHSTTRTSSNSQTSLSIGGKAKTIRLFAKLVGRPDVSHASNNNNNAALTATTGGTSSCSSSNIKQQSSSDRLQTCPLATPLCSSAPINSTQTSNLKTDQIQACDDETSSCLQTAVTVTSNTNTNTNSNVNLKQQQQQRNSNSTEKTNNDADVESTAAASDASSTPTKQQQISKISEMKREHKAAKTLGIIMGAFILCWLPFFVWYTSQNICGQVCENIIPQSVVTFLFWIGYFNSALNPIIYAYFNSEFRLAFKQTLEWLFCCRRSTFACLRSQTKADNQHYNCTYRSTQEIGLVGNA